MKFYDLKCPECNEVTIHQVCNISRTKGLKLQCMKCLNETHWINSKVPTLKEAKI